MKAFKILSVLVLGLFLLAAPALAVPIIDFETGGTGPGGVLFFFGGDASGTGIPVNNMTVSGTAASDGVYDTQGTFAYSGGTAAILNFNTQTNFIEIIGGVSALGIPLDTTLLSGTFSQFLVFPGQAVQGSGVDQKADILLLQLALPLDTPWSFFGFSITGQPIPGVPNTWEGLSTDVKNTGKVPEPISLILLGSGLAGAGLYRRFRKPRG